MRTTKSKSAGTEEIREIRDSWCGAYLSYCGLTVEAGGVINGLVFFKASGPNVDAMIEEYAADPTVKLQSFLIHLRRMKAIVNIVKYRNG